MNAWAIVWFENDLWWYQGQGHCGRTTKGGFVTKRAAIEAAAKDYGADVLITVNE